MKTLFLLPLFLLCSCASMPSPDPLQDQDFPNQFLISRAPHLSSDFYESAFGWKVVALEEGVWTFQESGGGTVGALIQIPKAEEEADAAVWLTTYVHADFDGVLDRAVAEGGEIRHGPVNVKGGFRTAVLEDPQGATLQIREGERTPDAEGSGWIWRELVTGDVAAAAEWLEAVLGVETRPSETEGRLEVLLDGIAVAGISENPLLDAPNQWIPVREAEDLPSVIKRVEESGGEVVLRSDSDASIVLIADSLNAPLLLQEMEGAP